MRERRRIDNKSGSNVNKILWKRPGRNVSLSSFFRDQFEIVHVAQVAFKNHPTTLLTWYGNNGNDAYMIANAILSLSRVRINV